MPVRFTSPSLGGHRQAILPAGSFELGLSYRNLKADDWFILDTLTPSDGSRAPGGQPNVFSINSVDFSLAYGVSNRLSLQLTVPTASGSNSRIHPDGNRHVTNGSGIGDINLVGTMWLLDPLTHGTGNVAVGLGVKARPGVTLSAEISAFPREPFNTPFTPASRWATAAGVLSCRPRRSAGWREGCLGMSSGPIS